MSPNNFSGIKKKKKKRRETEGNTPKRPPTICNIQARKNGKNAGRDDAPCRYSEDDCNPTVVFLTLI